MTNWFFMVSDVSRVARPSLIPGGAGRETGIANRLLAANSVWREPLFWLTLGLTLFAVAPFMAPGYFWGANDARHHVYFLFEYHRLVEDGIWWPRWSPDFAFGYGYPFFNIYGPFSHFVGELLLYFGGLSYTGAIKTVFGLSILGSAAAMYLFVRSWLGSAAAMVAALVYVYIPYHLLNLYVRANLAESMAFVWLPLCLWTVRSAVLRPSWGWVAGVALSYAGLMLTSNLVVVLFSGTLGLYWVVLVLVYSTPTSPHAGNPFFARLVSWVRTGIAPAVGIIAGLGLSAVFWLPAILEMPYVRNDQWFAGRYDFRGNFVYFHQLFSPQWGFGVSQAGPNDQFGFQLGVAPLVLAVLGALLAWPVLRWAERWEVAVFITAGLGGILLGLQISAPVWEWPLIGAIIQYAQFPWRWFILPAVCLSVLAGLVVHPYVLREEGWLSLPLLGLICVIILSSYPYLRVEIREPAEGPVSLAALMRFQQSSDEMTGSTAWVKEIPTWSPMADYYISQDEAGGPVRPVDTLVDYSNPTWPLDYESFGVASVAHSTVMEEIFFANRRETEQRIVFNHFYYPGWKAYLLDGEHGQPVRELPIIPEETGTLGRMTVPVPVGEGYILLRYEDTPPRTIGKMISLATVVLLAIFGVVAVRKRFRDRGD